LSGAATIEEEREFDRIRTRFVEACMANPDGLDVEAINARPDEALWLMMEMTVLAHRQGLPEPWPWFTEFARRMLDEDKGRRPPPEPPTRN
jgi:hypothetical protein